MAAAAFAADKSEIAASDTLFRAAFESIQSDDLRKHAYYLADDTFEGREAGSRGGRAAGVYIGQELRRYALAGGGDEGGYYQPFGENFRNIFGLLEGSDPRLRDEVVIVGAHYDHVGYGSSTTSLGPIGYIHNGADDNSSGTACMLEMIEAFMRLEARPKRTILFAFWDAEEKGLLGSKHWMTQPTISLERVRAKVNIDMIGRLRQETLTIYGVRSATGFRELLTRPNDGLGLRLQFSWEIKPNSDHHPFYARGIPVVMLHTGLHGDYHRPSDDADKLNIEGMQAASRYCFALIHDLANRPSLPEFRAQSRHETAERQRTFEQPAPPLSQRLGVSWATKQADEPGIRVAEVGRGSAAERGGLLAGDRILRCDGREVRDDGEFQSWVLAADKRLRLSVERSGEPRPRDLRVQLDGEPVRIGIAWREDEAEPNSVALSRVVPASPAHRGGLRVNDRIYSVSGKRFATSTEFQRLINASDDPFELEIDREGEIRRVRIEPNSLKRSDKKR
jgi:hypothetical protein